MAGEYWRFSQEFGPVARFAAGAEISKLEFALKTYTVCAISTIEVWSKIGV
jgi:hypothetical protein